MKKIILTTALIATALFVFSTASHAQGYHHFGWYNGMASVAENEIRTNEQKATASKDEKIADKITVADAEKGYLRTSEKTEEEN